MSRGSRRLFIALPVQDCSVAHKLTGLYSDLGKFSSLLKMVTLSDIHITMKFLGSVDEERSSEIINSFNSLEGPGRLSYNLKGIGCFPSLSALSVIWCGIDCDMKKLSELFMKVESFCESLGFSRETRRFTPHLTLARVRRGRDVPSALKRYVRDNRETLYAESVFDRLVLFESKLDKDGPEYIERAVVKLA